MSGCVYGGPLKQLPSRCNGSLYHTRMPIAFVHNLEGIILVLWCLFASEPLTQRLLQRHDNLFVETHPGAACGTGNGLVQNGFGTHDKLPGKWLFWLLSTLGAKRQIIFDGAGKCLLQLCCGRSLKGKDVAKIDNLAVEKAGFFIVFYNCFIAFVMHRAYGLISASSKKRLTDFTAPLSVSFCGWGR